MSISRRLARHCRIQKSTNEPTYELYEGKHWALRIKSNKTKINLRRLANNCITSFCSSWLSIEINSIWLAWQKSDAAFQFCCRYQTTAKFNHAPKIKIIRPVRIIYKGQYISFVFQYLYFYQAITSRKWQVTSRWWTNIGRTNLVGIKRMC